MSVTGVPFLEAARRCPATAATHESPAHPLRVELHRRAGRPGRVECAGHPVALRRRAAEHQEPAAAGTEHLTAGGAGRPADLVELVQARGGDAAGQAALLLPSLVQALEI